MKIRLTALLNVKSDGVEKSRKKVKGLKDDMKSAADNADRMNKSLAKTRVAKGARERAGVGPDYTRNRSVTGARDAAGRNFSGLARGGGGGGSFVGAYAEIAANVFALTAAFQALSDAARVEQLTQGLELMGARGGVALKSVAKDLRDVTGNAISTADAMRSVAQASAAGLGQDEIVRLGQVARGASLALGRDMSDSMDRLTRGAIKLEPELLDELGIMVRLDEAVKTYAEQNNKAASSLTQTERRQAFLNAVLEEGESKFGEISKQIEANPYDRLSASVRDMGTAFFNLINGPLKILVNIFANNPFLLVIPGILLAGKALRGLGLQFTDLDKVVSKNMKNIKNSIAASRIDNIDLKNVTTLGQLNTQFKDAAKSSKGFAAANVRLVQTTTLLSIGIRSLVASFGPMLAIMAAFYVGAEIFKGLQRLVRHFQGITKEIIEARKALKDFNDSTAKTLDQLDSMRPGEQFDALANSLQAARSELKKLQDAYAGVTAEQQKQAKLDEKKFKGTSSYGPVTLNARLKEMGIKGEGSKEERDFIAQTLVTLEKFAPERAKIVEEAINEGVAAEKLRDILKDQLGFLDDITGRFSSVRDLVQDLQKNMSDLAPKEFESSSTKAFDNLIDLNKEIIAGAKSAEALADEFKNVSLEEFSNIRELVGLYTENDETFKRTIAKKQKIADLEAEIQRLSEKTGILEKANAFRLSLQVALQEKLLGIALRKDLVEASAEAEAAKQNRINLAVSKDRIAAEIKLAGAKKQTNSLQNKLNALQRETTTGQEASIVFSILDKQANLETLDVLRKRKELIDEETENSIANKREQAIQQGMSKAALDEEIELIRDAATERKNQLDLEQQIAQQEIANLQTKLQNLASGNAAKKEEIAQSQKILSLEKSIVSERQKLASAQLQGERIAAEQAAGPRGLTVQQEADFAKRQHQLKIDNIQDELDSLTREKDLKFKNLLLEADIRQMELRYLKEEIASNPNLSADQKSSLTSSIDSISSRLTDNLVEIISLEQDLFSARRDTLNQLKSNEEAVRSGIADTPEKRFQEAMGGIGDGGFVGLTGAAQTFAQQEIRALGPNASEADKERIKDMAFALEEANIAAEGFNDIMGTVQSSISDAFLAMMDGSKTAKQAFADMAQAVLKQIAQIIVKLLVVKALQAIGIPIPGAGGGIIPYENGGIIPLATGGVVNRKDGLAGVVKQPTYLVGEGRYDEAVVPLPNGRAIPVQMHGSGGGGDMNNVTVNVNVEGGQTSSEGNGERAQKLGQMVSSAVQKELMAQKQPGGLLSKYG